MCFFFNDTATTEIYTLSLHDALPISRRREGAGAHLIEGGRRRERVLRRAPVGGPVPLSGRGSGRQRVGGGGLGEVPDRGERDQDRRDQQELDPSPAPHQLSPHDG